VSTTTKKIVQQIEDFSGSVWSNRLLNAIVEIQAAHIEESDIQQSFGRMLECLLDLTESEYGFLGEVLYSKEGLPYIVTHALTDISWDDETRKLYESNMAKGFELHNLNTLFGATLATGETVISNEPDKDPRGGGLPHGHPGMHSYLGVPIKHRDEMLGMLGIANRKDGYQVEIVEALSPLLITAGSIIHAMRSLNKNLTTESKLKDKNDLLNGVIHNITDALIITDYQGNILETNHATEEMFGYHSQELIGRHLGQYFTEKSKNDYIEQLKSFLLSGDRLIIQRRTEMSALGKNQKKFPTELAVNDIKLGNRKLFVNVIQDISERKSQEKKLAEANKKLLALSETDELTGLYNRRYFDKAFRKELNRRRKPGCDVALAIIDIDHFKAYNDNYGHLKGDQCLARIGTILKEYFKRDCEFAVRIGGEEFAIVMTHMSRQECIDAMHGLLKVIARENIKHPESVTPRLSISVGLAMSKIDRKSESVKEVYGRADRALYAAKEQGRNRFVESEDE
jgi:diguanylate cyclase (GGDEF)-like protein/PAS domain S-box-containing protein